MLSYTPQLINYVSPLKTPPEHKLKCLGNNEQHCKNTFPLETPIYECTCSTHELLEVELDMECLKTVSPEEWRHILKKRAEKTYLKGGRNIGVFGEFVPVKGKIVSLSEGWTPIDDAYEIAKSVGLKHLEVKSLGLNPTGSFKDYGMTMLFTHLLWLYENGYVPNKKVACASTGNTSSSMTAYAKRIGFEPYVFIPDKVAPSKIFQTKFLGANIIQIDGAFDDAMRYVDELAKGGDFYMANSKNPFRIEGQKTIIWETLLQKQKEGSTKIDTGFVVVLPVGNAGNAAAMTKALYEWKELGIIDDTPCVIGVQAEGAAPLAEMIETGGAFKEVENPQTYASAIKIGNPVSGEKAVKGILATGGTIIRVSDEEIYRGQKILAQTCGVGCEPASATTIAALDKLVNEGLVDKSENVICMLTGNLLKDTETPVILDPSIMNWPKVPADKDAILEILHSY